ncbi:MAG: diguanylate cyclase [Candidatus Eremiobacteraeota bacterium]|nr:diguanylate cyclase [Candidatus Eremiobacteraeota bacterium]
MVEVARDGQASALLEEVARFAASDGSLRPVLPELCVLLAQYLDAKTLTLVLVDAQGRRAAFAHPQGQSTDADEQLASQALSGEAVEAPGLLVQLLQFGDRAMGAVVVRRNLPFETVEAATLATWSSIVALRIHHDRVELDKERFETIAGRDQLTGIANRRAFDSHVQRVWERSRETGEPISIVLLDVDYFKAYNDRYGHLAGDAALHRVAQTLEVSLQRSTDLLARYGGEEFVVVLADCSESDAIGIAERMRQATIDIHIENDRSQIGIVTVSIGVASARATLETNASIVIEQADRALYGAKEAGRNRVVSATYRSDTPAVLRRVADVPDVVRMQTSFIGRVAESAAVGRAVERSRLVTIAGPGGIGKTRLAAHVAFESIAGFPDGISYADVSATVEDGDALTAVAIAIGVKERPNSTLFDSVASALRKQNALIVLDGCERALNRVRTLVDELLIATRYVKILIVSRETLGIPGESVVRLGGLSPKDAAALFADRSQHTGGANGHSVDCATIETICEDVDYLPLAIEIIAARADALSHGRLQLQSSGSTALKSPEDVLLWSIDLLPVPCKSALARLSTFSSDFDIAAALDVADVDLNDLAELESKLLIFALHRDGKPRYRLLEQTRDLMRAEFDAPRRDHLDRAHFSYYAALARENVASRMILERVNIRAALVYADEADQTEALLRLIEDIAPTYLRLGYVTEGLHWLRLGISKAHDIPDDVLAPAYRYAGMLARRQNDMESARTFNERALELMRATNNQAGIGSALNGLALIAHTTGDFAQAQTLYEESLLIHERLYDEVGVVQVVNNLGGLALYRSDLNLADAYFSEALARVEFLGNESLEALTLSNLAELRFLQGRLPESIEVAQASLRIRLAIVEKPGLAASWLTLGHAYVSLHYDDKAWHPFRESLLLYHEIGDRRGVGAAMFGVARLLISRGRSPEGAKMYRIANRVFENLGLPIFGAERVIRDLLAAWSAAQGLTATSEADEWHDSYEGAFEYALASFR